MSRKGKTYWFFRGRQPTLVRLAMSRENFVAARTGTVAVSAAIGMSVACAILVPYGYVWPALACVALAGADYERTQRRKPHARTKHRQRRRFYTS